MEDTQIDKIQARETPQCKWCGSFRTVKFGSYRGIQRWWCNDCYRKFAGNYALPGMKTPYDQVALALESYFLGTSLTQITALLFRQYGTFTTPASVFHWVEHFCQAVTKELGKIRPIVGGRWVLDEILISPDQKLPGVWVRDVIDARTHYLRASEIFQKASPDDPSGFLSTAISKTLGQPDAFPWLAGDVVFTDHSDLEFFRYWRSAANTRSRILRKLKKPEKLKLVLDTWGFCYNFLSRQEILAERTPGEVARVDFKIHSWVEIVRILNIFPPINQNSKQNK